MHGCMASRASAAARAFSKKKFIFNFKLKKFFDEKS